MKMSEKYINRREFLKLTAVGIAVAAGTRAVTSTKAFGSAPKGKHQWVMVIDQSKCIGCGYCTLACQAHNDVNPDIQWNKVNEVDMIGDKHVFLHARVCTVRKPLVWKFVQWKPRIIARMEL